MQGNLSALAAQPSLALQMTPQVAAQIASQMSGQLAMQLQHSAEVRNLPPARALSFCTLSATICYSFGHYDISRGELLPLPCVHLHMRLACNPNMGFVLSARQMYSHLETS